MKCSIIRDLLPLYCDKLTSAESNEEIENHLRNCAECTEIYENMSKEKIIMTEQDKNIKPLKKVKKYFLICLICGILGTSAVLLSGFSVINTDCSMNYEKYNIAENVWVEEENDGTLWLVKKNSAVSADFIYPTISDENGRHLGYDKDFDSNAKVGYGITLKHRKIDAFTVTEMNADGAEERTRLNNIKERGLTKIFYYDDIKDKEYILWEE